MENIKKAVTIYAESTPNPMVMKFVANKMIIEGDALEYKNIEEAKASPLAYQLFHFPFIKEVFISGNFIALAKFDVIAWEEVSAELREFVRNWLHEGKKVVDESVKIATETISQPEKESNKIVLPEFESLSEIEQRIVEILDEYVAPAVSADGGMIRFISYEDKIVKVLLQGACSGCPSSTATLKQGISGLLQKMLPTLVKDVQAVNG
jgi:NFU1 iron-sulfur cluster scaffold homolog, mitochondrial